MFHYLMEKEIHSKNIQKKLKIQKYHHIILFLNKNQDKNNRKNNSNDISENSNITNYINHKFKRNAINKMDIDPKYITKIDVGGDGNCLMDCFSLFIYKNENLNTKIRKDISDYLRIHKEDFVEFVFEKKIGILNIEEYLKYIVKPDAWGGQLEKYIAEILFKINIVDYKENINDLGNISYNFIDNHTYDNNYNKDLCIFLQIDNNHFNLLLQNQMKIIIIKSIKRNKANNINKKEYI